MAQQELPKLKFFIKLCGNTRNSHLTFMNRLRQSLNVVEECNVAKESDVIFAFVAGTDIEAALREIPQEWSKPIVLVVLHHTTQEDFVNPNRRSVNRQQVFIVDCLFQENRGFLRCQQNDKALSAVIGHLVALGASERSMTEAYGVLDWLVTIICMIFAAVGLGFLLNNRVKNK